MAKKLTKKQLLFCNEYLTDLNQTRAYIAAGYSEKGAAQSASALLRNPNVSEYIAKKTGKRLEKLEITAERTLLEIARLAYFDPRKLFNSDGSPKQINELDDDTAAAVAGIEFAELFEGTGDEKHAYGLMKKYKVTDKVGALNMAAKYHKLLTDKSEVTHKITLEQLVASFND